jgi:Zn-finger nucleic acid-binding protein
MVGIGASHCPRCGATIQRAEESSAGLSCPGCKTPLVSTSVGGVSLDQCHACGGLWVGQQNFEHLAADRAERGEILGALPGEGPKVPAHLEAVHYRPCPQCGNLMNRLNYGRISGVVLDVCKAHGLWFDKDKLRQVLAFIDGGGLEKSRARQVQADEDRLRQATVAALPEPGAWAEADPVLFEGGSLISAFESLLHLVRRS